MIEPPLVRVDEPTTVRLIAAKYADAPQRRPLADTAHDQAIVAAVAALTAPGSRVTLPGGLAMSDLQTEADGANWVLVNAAFCRTRPTGNRFNEADRGAWYAACGDAAAVTAKAEVAWHLSRELAATGVFHNVTEYREIVAAVACDMHDLRGSADLAALHPDPAIGYPAGQSLARDLRLRGGNGVLYPSVRHFGGLCLVAFKPRLVREVRRGRHWRFTWAGTPAPTISLVG